MTQTTDFLAEKLAEMDRRLEELKPLHEEYVRLERARAALGDFTRGPRIQRQANGNGRRHRARKGGTRAEQALALVRENPGLTVAEVAERLKATPNYFYRVFNGLQAEGLVRREGAGYVPVE